MTSMKVVRADGYGVLAIAFKAGVKAAAAVGCVTTEVVQDHHGARLTSAVSHHRACALCETSFQRIGSFWAYLTPTCHHDLRFLQFWDCVVGLAGYSISEEDVVRLTQGVNFELLPESPPPRTQRLCNFMAGASAG